MGSNSGGSSCFRHFRTSNRSCVRSFRYNRDSIIYSHSFIVHLGTGRRHGTHQFSLDQSARSVDLFWMSYVLLCVLSIKFNYLKYRKNDYPTRLSYIALLKTMDLF